VFATVTLLAFTACGNPPAPVGGGGATTPPTASRSSAAATSTSAMHAPAPATWRRIGALPVERDYFTPAQAVWDGEEMLVVVTSMENPSGFCRETVIGYDPAADAWRVITRVPTPKGCYEGVDRPVWTGHELLTWGISNAAYDPSTDTWRKLPSPPAGAGGPSVVVWTGTQMIGWGGGCCDQELADGAAYTPATNSWRMLPPSPLLGRHATGVWTGTEMIVAGGSGYDEHGHDTHFRDAAAYDPKTRTWRKLPPMPVARGGGYYTQEYTAVWDGTEMLMIGGTPGEHASSPPLARGVAYSPSRNAWRWLTPMAYPRSGFVSAWTGDQLVVWGGVGVGGAIPPSGETYDPATDAWSSLPRAPLRARVGAVAIWTDSEMVVWGGQDARHPETVLFDGAALTPEAP
jgi:N-acetylneuraminic acid mutarotase